MGVRKHFRCCEILYDAAANLQISVLKILTHYKFWIRYSTYRFHRFHALAERKLGATIDGDSLLTRSLLRFCYRKLADDRDAERVFHWIRGSRWSTIADGVFLEHVFDGWLLKVPQASLSSALDDVFSLFDMFAAAQFSARLATLDEARAQLSAESLSNMLGAIRETVPRDIWERLVHLIDQVIRIRKYN